MLVNRRVKNATPLVYDSIQFKSKLEVYCYRRLKECNILANYEPIKFVIQPGFTLFNEKIRPITYTPDFIGNEWILETKGIANELFPMRWKLIKRM